MVILRDGGEVIFSGLRTSPYHTMIGNNKMGGRPVYDYRGFEKILMGRNRSIQQS